MPHRIFSPHDHNVIARGVFSMWESFAQRAVILPTVLPLNTQGRSSPSFAKRHRLLAALNSAASSATPSSHFSSHPPSVFFPALRSTLRSLPVGELQSTGVGGHHGDGGAAPGSHRGALARGRRAARPVGQNGSSGRGGESRGCSQVGRFFSCTASM